MDAPHLDSAAVGAAILAGTAGAGALLRGAIRALVVAIETLVVRSVAFMDRIEVDIAALRKQVEAQGADQRARADTIAKTLEAQASSLDSHLAKLTETIRTRDLS
jgi:outer membrane murein-binding lipoprotein Lpp